MIGDAAVWLGAFALAYFLRVGFILSSDFPLLPYLLVAALVTPVWLGTLVASRTFGLTRNQYTLRALGMIVYATIVGTALFALTYYFLFGLFFSRLLLVTAFCFAAVGTWLWHLLMQPVLRSALRRSPAVFPTLIIGATREAGRLIAALQQSQNPLCPVAVLDSHAGKDQHIGGVPVRGRLHKLEEVLKAERITHLIQCSDLEHSLNFASLCRTRGITYLLLPSVLGILEGEERVDMLEGHPVTVADPTPSKWAWFFR